MRDRAAYWQDPLRQRRCPARVEPNPTGYHGRCDRPRGHDGHHALERGMDAPTWSTTFTGTAPTHTGAAP